MSFRPSQLSESSLLAQKKDTLSHFKFPKEFKLLMKTEVDYFKINRPILTRYATNQLLKALDLKSAEDDDITIDFIINLIFEEKLKPDELCVQILPFLNDDSEKTTQFAMDVWKKRIAAQEDRDDTEIEEETEKDVIDQEMIDQGMTDQGMPEIVIVAAQTKIIVISPVQNAVVIPLLMVLKDPHLPVPVHRILSKHLPPLRVKRTAHLLHVQE
ncbi:unnamed protein product [Ambrosiozyma monospora]|uniref:U1 small nuclear ribonucleoprotein component SNU71 n=1 Tax=Ambrosiozyma monospora TaxID=43982 RepID=A0A9W6WKU8_AMBMO|nr:unnamed protein product [Ambrosiozyma monospora]